MYRRNVDARPGPASLLTSKNVLHWLNDGLLFADIAVGATIGYLSVRLYLDLSNLVVGPFRLGILVWRELILTSVITALVMRKVDYAPANERLDIRAFLRGVVARAVLAGIILSAVGIVTGTLNDMARTWLAAWATLFMGWLVASRLAILIYQRHLAVHGALREAIALIVLDTVCASDKRALVERLSLKADVITIADRSLSDDSSFKAALTQIVSLAQGGAIGLVVLASNAGQSCGDNAEIINRLKTTPVQVALCDNYQHQEGSSPRLRIIAGFPMRLLVDHPLNRNDLLTKAIMDRVGAVVLLALASPLLAAVALAVLLETEGPIIFRQSRSGCCGKPFNVYKFRTMKHESSDALVHQTVRGDSRFTRIGALLRKTSLDELPQLWNVLVGQMSLVGPRPHADGLHSREREAKFLLDDYAQRQRVKPGLTGWAQVHGLRGAADTPEKLRLRIEMDLYYIEHWTIWLDLRIIARTPWAVLSTENAF